VSRLVRLMAAAALTATLSLATFAVLRSNAISTPGPEVLSVSTDDGLALALSADGRALNLTMDGDPLPAVPGPALWVRDMSSAGQVSEPNLLINRGVCGADHRRSAQRRVAVG
jgi:hypothetical protein